MRRAVSAIVLLAACGWPTREAVAKTDGRDPADIYDVDLALDGTIIGVTALGSLAPLALGSYILQPSCPCSPASVNGFDRGVIGNASDTADIISDVTVALAIAVPPVANWIALRRVRPWLDDLVVFTESLSVNGALVTVAKYTVQRPIPRVYADPTLVNDRGSYRSFYSGHVSSAFAALSAAAVTVNARYGLTWEPWAVTVAIGASVGVERVLAGYHFYTDVLVGAGAGLAVGAGVSVLHLHHGGLRLSVFRPPAGEGMGLSLAGAL